MVDWIAFVQVAVVTIVAAVFVAGLYGLGVRLQAVAEDEGRATWGYKAGAWCCFGVCGLVILLGIAMIVPQLQPLIGL